MSAETTDKSLDDIRRRQGVATRQYGIACERKRAWAKLLKGIQAVEQAYRGTEIIPADLMTTFYEVVKFGAEQYGKLSDYLTAKETELHDLDAKIKVRCDD